MDPLQTDYSLYHDRWIEGMILNMEAKNIVSRIAEGAPGIGFGKVACYGTDEQQVLPAAAGLNFLGITLLDRTQLQDSYPQYAMVNIMTKGVVVVQASVAVAPGDPVYFVPATGVLTNVDGGGANTQIDGAKWDTKTTAAGLAAIRLG